MCFLGFLSVSAYVFLLNKMRDSLLWDVTQGDVSGQPVGPIIKDGLTLEDGTVKANSHMPCRAHAVPLTRRAALIHTCHTAPLPFSDSAVSFVKVRVVAGNIRTASPTV
jgi:hypothetical protein